VHPLIQKNLSALEDLCLRYRVARLDLFGSALRDEFDPATSDFDFLVEFAPMAPAEHADSFFSLLEGLGNLFGKRVDLLEREPIVNPYLWRSIQRSRQPLYEAA
jgi:predicted nucleotidyltransferase